MTLDEFDQKIREYIALSIPPEDDFEFYYAGACCLNLMREHLDLTVRFFEGVDGWTFGWFAGFFNELVDIVDSQVFMDLLWRKCREFPEEKVESFVEEAEYYFHLPRQGNEPKLKPWYIGYELGDYLD